jgi:hypothetical protein
VAPWRSASIALSTLACAVSSTNGTPGAIRRARVEQRETRHALHLEVGEHEVGGLALERRDRGLGAVHAFERHARSQRVAHLLTSERLSSTHSTRLWAAVESIARARISPMRFDSAWDRRSRLALRPDVRYPERSPRADPFRSSKDRADSLTPYGAGADTAGVRPARARRRPARRLAWWRSRSLDC